MRCSLPEGISPSTWKISQDFSNQPMRGLEICFSGRFRRFTNPEKRRKISEISILEKRWASQQFVLPERARGGDVTSHENRPHLPVRLTHHRGHTQRAKHARRLFSLRNTPTSRRVSRRFRGRGGDVVTPSRSRNERGHLRGGRRRRLHCAARVRRLPRAR